MHPALVSHCKSCLSVFNRLKFTPLTTWYHSTPIPADTCISCYIFLKKMGYFFTFSWHLLYLYYFSILTSSHSQIFHKNSFLMIIILSPYLKAADARCMTWRWEMPWIKLHWFSNTLLSLPCLAPPTKQFALSLSNLNKIPRTFRSNKMKITPTPVDQCYQCLVSLTKYYFLVFLF